MIKVSPHHVSTGKPRPKELGVLPQGGPQGGLARAGSESRSPRLGALSAPPPPRPRLTVPGWGERPRPHLRRSWPHAAPTSCRCPAGPGPGTLGLCPAPRRDPGWGGGPHDRGGRRSLRRRWQRRRQRLHHFPPWPGVGGRRRQRRRRRRLRHRSRFSSLAPRPKRPSKAHSPDPRRPDSV